MARDLTGVYYAKNTATGVYADLTTSFNGLRILKVDGFLSQGKPVNIYTAQWVNSQKEDFLITTKDTSGNPKVIRENGDIDITFIVHDKYASSGTTIDVMQVHDSFIAYMTNTDVWIKSAYAGNKSVHCACLQPYKPTTVKLQRGAASWVMGTLTLHMIDKIE